MVIVLPLAKEGVLLRPLSMEDLPFFLAYRNEPEVARYQGWEIPYPLENGKALIESLGKDLVSGQPMQLALQVDGVLVGDLYCSWLERKAEIGFSLDRGFWGRSAARRGLQLLISALAQAGVQEVIAIRHPDNSRCENLLKRLGFVEDGLLDGDVVYRLTPADPFKS